MEDGLSFCFLIRFSHRCEWESEEATAKPLPRLGFFSRAFSFFALACFSLKSRVGSAQLRGGGKSWEGLEEKHTKHSRSSSLLQKKKCQLTTRSRQRTSSRDSVREMDLVATAVAVAAGRISERAFRNREKRGFF